MKTAGRFYFSALLISALVLGVLFLLEILFHQPRIGKGGRMLVQTRLRRIAVALHNYYDVNGCFPPPAITSTDGPLLSWRVLILPYLDESDLYNQFRLN